MPGDHKQKKKVKDLREKLGKIGKKKDKVWADRPYANTEWDVGGTPEDYQIDPKTGESTYKPEFDDDGNPIDYGRPDDAQYEEEQKKKTKDILIYLQNIAHVLNLKEKKMFT